jgi:capsular polysaccharide biosynthesis protein
MEFREIIVIFRKHKHYFWMSVFGCVLVGFFFQQLQPMYVTSNLTLNVTRLGSDKTTDYQYHDFYRLQADERFADTVVRWLESPRIVSDIYADTRINTAEKNKHAFKAKRLSSQMIQVTYVAVDEASAQKIAQSLIDRVNTETRSLDKEQQESAWFTVIGNDPVASDGRISILFILTISFVLGIFVGFWVVLGRHYFSSNRKI